MLHTVHASELCGRSREVDTRLCCAAPCVAGKHTRHGWERVADSEMQRGLCQAALLVQGLRTRWDVFARVGDQPHVAPARCRRLHNVEYECLTLGGARKWGGYRTGTRGARQAENDLESESEETSESELSQSRKRVRAKGVGRRNREGERGRQKGRLPTCLRRPSLWGGRLDSSISTHSTFSTFWNEPKHLKT